MFTPADHTQTDLPSRAEATPCPALTPPQRRRGVNYRRGHRAPFAPRAARSFTGACCLACLRCLPAKSDAVINPCAADREPLPSLRPPPPPLVPLWLAVAAAVRMWSPQRSALHPSESIGEEDEMFFPLSPVPIPPSEHHPILHLPHRRQGGTPRGCQGAVSC